MEIRLDGRCAFVTGGSRGLGWAMATRFAQSGADVAIMARRAEQLEEARAAISEVTEEQVFAYQGDAGSAVDLARIFESAVNDMGKIDILVNNAGSSKAGPFESITDAEWQEDFDLKVFAAIRLIRLALPGMKERSWGRIINILNIGAKAPRAGGAPTQVSRAAGLAITKIVAGEVASHNILVNALCTGLVVTDQIVARHEREAPDQPLEEFIAKFGKNIPVGRMGSAEEYANVACLLASDAGGFVSGTAINIDGGACAVV